MTAPATESEFAALAERHRHEFRVHCYRMLGSFDEAEDAAQETFLSSMVPKSSASTSTSTTARASTSASCS